MKVLVAAYACEPLAGSEQGAAWNIVSRLARTHEMWVVTRANNRGPIEAHLERHPIPSLTFVYHDLPGLMRFKKLPGGLYVYHYAWHVRLGRLAAGLHRKISFDVVHHLTLGSFRYPSGLAGLDVPLLIGPVGGAEEAPPRFWFGLGIRGMAIELARWLSNRLALLDPVLRRSFDGATIFASTEETRRQVARISPSSPIHVLPQSGVDPQALSAKPRSRAETVRILHVARLVPWKGSRLALRAFIQAQRRILGLELTILGVGPMRAALHRLIARKRIRNVRLIGRLDKIEDVYDLYRNSDIFLFPSLHDSGGMAVLEAMAAGLPVVCLDLGGPGVAITQACGVAVPASSPRAAVRAMADAIVRIAGEPETRDEMGEAARERAAEYAWDQKVAILNRAYESLTEFDD